MKTGLKRFFFILGFSLIWIMLFLPVSALRESIYGASSYQGFATLGNYMMIIYVIGIIIIFRVTKKKKVEVTSIKKIVEIEEKQINEEELRENVKEIMKD